MRPNRDKEIMAFIITLACIAFILLCLAWAKPV